MVRNCNATLYIFICVHYAYLGNAFRHKEISNTAIDQNVVELSEILLFPIDMLISYVNVNG